MTTKTDLEKFTEMFGAESAPAAKAAPKADKDKFDAIFADAPEPVAAPAQPQGQTVIGEFQKPHALGKFGPNTAALGASIVRKQQYKKDLVKARNENIQHGLFAGEKFEPNWNDPKLTLDLALSNLPEEKVSKLKGYFPNVGFRSVFYTDPVSGERTNTQLFRVNKLDDDEPWKPIDGPYPASDTLMPEAIPLAKGIGTVVSDPAVLGGVAGAILAPEALLARMAASGGGAIMGSLLGDRVEKLRGHQQDPFATQALDAAWEGAMAASGETLGAAAGLVSAFSTGRHPMQIAAKEALGDFGRFLTQRGLDVPHVLVSRGGLWRRIAIQHDATSASQPLTRAVQDQQRAAYRHAEEAFSNGNFAGMSDEQIQGYLNMHEERLANAMGPFGSKGDPKELFMWRKRSEELVDDAYASARKLLSETDDGAVIFDLSDVQANVRSKYNTGRQGRFIDPENPNKFPHIATIDKYPPGFQEVLDDISTAHPMVSIVKGINKKSLEVREKTTSLDQMMAWRHRVTPFLDDKNPGVAKAANDLYGDLTKAIENPVGPTNPEFVAQWQRANGFANQIHELTVMKGLRNAAQDNIPYNVFIEGNLRVGNPESYRLFSTMKDYLPPEEWAGMKQAHAFNLIDDLTRAEEYIKIGEVPGSRAMEKIKALTNDPETRRLFYSDREWETLTGAVRAQHEFYKGPAGQYFKQELSEAQRALAVIDSYGEKSVDGRQLIELRQAIDQTGGMNGEFAESLRAAYLRRAFTRAQTEFTEAPNIGQTAIDMKILSAEMDKLMTNPNAQLIFRADDVRAVKMYAAYADVLSTTMGAGGDLIRARLISDLSKVSRAGFAMKAFASNEVITRILASRSARQPLLRGASAEPMTSATFSGLGASMMLLTNQYNQQIKEREALQAAELIAITNQMQQREGMTHK